MKKIIFPVVKNGEIEKLKAGEEIIISGIIYAARDAAHKKFIEIINKGKKLPVEIKNSLIYYMGPSPAPPGKIIGSCGPTTSIRMDNLTIPLFQIGLKSTMGKGKRSNEIVKACKKYRSVYFITYGGCGAYLSKFIKKFKCIAFPELGPEGVFELTVENFPAIVGIDIYGNSIFK